MKRLSLMSLILSMTVFGTIGVFRNYIPFPSAFLAMSRGFIGALFILLFLILSKKGINFKSIKNNLKVLIITGVFIGINWILLFESYKYTTVAIATLCYYMAPLFVTVASGIFFGERLTAKKIICVLGALVGMVLVSGVADGEMPSGTSLIGIILGLGAALFYASVTLISKKVHDISAFDMTLVQLFSAAIVVVPYTVLFEKVEFSMVSATAIWLTLTVGILHTGISYVMYFTSVKNLEASKVAIFSYLDPIIAIILSAVILDENMSVAATIGAVLILAFALMSELKLSPLRKKGKKL